jgi:hypothetical protein
MNTTRGCLQFGNKDEHWTMHVFRGLLLKKNIKEENLYLTEMPLLPSWFQPHNHP